MDIDQANIKHADIKTARVENLQVKKLTKERETVRIDGQEFPVDALIVIGGFYLFGFMIIFALASSKAIEFLSQHALFGSYGLTAGVGLAAAAVLGILSAQAKGSAVQSIGVITALVIGIFFFSMAAIGQPYDDRAYYEDARAQEQLTKCPVPGYKFLLTSCPAPKARTKVAQARPAR